MKNLERKLIRRSDSGLEYLVDNMSTRFGVTIAIMQGITQFKFKESQSKVLNAIWSIDSKNIILHQESVLSFNEIRNEIGDNTFSNERIFDIIKELFRNTNFQFYEEMKIPYQSFKFINTLVKNEEALVVEVNHEIIRTILAKEIFEKMSEELSSMESDYVRQLFLNIESERIKNKIKRKAAKSLIISPISLLFGLSLLSTKLSDEYYEKVLVLLKTVKSQRYLKSWRVQDDGNIAIEFFEPIKYNMDSILMFSWE